MIYLGIKIDDKNKIIDSYIKKNNINKVFILSPKKFYFNSNYEFIEWNNIIRYKYYYRLLKDIDNGTLLVINECLRTQNRYDLTYNCIRNYLNQTKHQIIFQYLPIIENINDFMILFDFDTRSRWKRENYKKELLINSKIICNKINLKLNRININVSQQLKTKYENKKNKLVNNIGLKDPHTIPRNLYLLSGKEKYNYIKLNSNSLFFNNGLDNYWFVGRNNRFKINNFQTFKENKYKEKYIIFEFCHNFINFIDFVYLSNQFIFDVFVSELKIDNWYFDRCNEWIERLNNVYTEIY